MRFATGHQPQQVGMVRQYHTTLAAAHHGQRNLQRGRPAGRKVRHAAVDADLGLRIEAQAQPLPRRLQPVFDVGLQAFGIEATEQRLAGEIGARFLGAGELFAASERAAGRGQPVDEAQPLGSPDDGLVEPGRQR